MNLSMVKSEPIYARQSSRQQGKFLFHYVVHTIPLVKQELKYWRNEAGLCVDQALQIQALNSINSKDFHCYGGAVFAITAASQEKELIKLIVAYQTICDYLDNLCDRNDCLDGQAFRQLHRALQDALQPGKSKSNYYQYYPHKDDGAYLDKLVEECRSHLLNLPSYHLVYKDLVCLAQWYTDLQVKKHLSLKQRETMLIEWADTHISNYPGIQWQEFAAASGSTLAVFALLALASQNNVAPQASRQTVAAYFPWICGLHILLDYFIDQEEDREGKDLNFTFYYADNEEMLKRLKLFIHQAHRQASQLSNSIFTKTVTEGLLALYLSDVKIKQQGYQKIARSLIDESGRSTLYTYRLCSLVRKYF